MYKHKAIFKGVVNKVLWGVDFVRYTNPHIITYNYHNNSIMNRQTEKRFKDSDNNCWYDFEKYEVKEELKEIWSGEIPRPVLDVGEEIYINDLDIVVKVVRKYRTTNDEIIYETDHIVETLINDKTEESRLKAVDDWFKLSYPNIQKFEQLEKEDLAVEEEVAEEVVEEKKETRFKSLLNWLKNN